MSLDDFQKKHLGERCGRCGETVGAADQTFDALLKLQAAREREEKASGNYVANDEVNATRVLFANGRTVKIVKGRLVVGWAKAEAEKVFASGVNSHD